MQTQAVLDAKASLLEQIDWSKAIRLEEVLALFRTEPRIDDCELKPSARLQWWSEQLNLDPDRLLRLWSTCYGASLSDVERALDANRSTICGTRIPQWALKLEEILNLYLISDDLWRDDESSFQDLSHCLIWPWLWWARNEFLDQLATIGSDAEKYCSPMASIDLYQALASELKQLVERTATLELNAARIRGALQGATPRDRYLYFCNYMTTAPSALIFWSEYISLARIITERCMQWLAKNITLLTRFQNDLTLLVSSGLIKHDSTQITKIRSVGDSHSGGQRVTLISCGPDNLVVYKPRVVHGEQILTSVLEWLSLHGIVHSLICPTIIAGDKYGWAKFMPHTRNHASDDLALFYYSAGVLLAVADCLNMKDLTNDNLIAVHGKLCVIDAECVLLPILSSEYHEVLWQDSIMSVGLLPGFQVAPGVDLSGLAGTGGNVEEHSMAYVTNQGTDTAQVARGATAFEAAGNLPHEGHVILSTTHTNNLIDGFCETASIMAAHRESLLDLVSNSCKTDERFKYIPRASMAYAKLSHEMGHPNLLRDAYDVDALFSHLSPTRKWLKHLYRSESNDLWSGDIPTFYTKPDSTSIWNSKLKEIPGVFALSGKAVLSGRLERIKAASYQKYCARSIRLATGALSPEDRFPRDFDLSSNIYRTCQDTASAIGRYLLDIAYHETGQLFWTQRAEDTTSVRADIERLEPMAYDLYSGKSGLLVFFSHLAAMTGNSNHTEAAKSLFSSCLRIVEAEIPTDSQFELSDTRAIIGAFNGPFSILLGMMHARESQFERDRIKRIVRKAIAALPLAIENDKRLDVVSGVAGLIHVLLAARAEFPDLPIDGCLSACEGRLLNAVHQEHGGCTWETLKGMRLTGYAHGVAGIVYSLTRSCRITKNSQISSMVKKALEWEDSYYRPSWKNWCDLRASNAGKVEAFSSGWCAGAPGIAMTRFEIDGVTRVAESLQQSSDAAHETLKSINALLSDGLCHGTFGNLEIVFGVAWRTRDHHLLNECEEALRSILCRIKADGFRFPGTTEPLGFMLGLAGIGYSLLRIASGGRIPSLLLMGS